MDDQLTMSDDEVLNTNNNNDDVIENNNGIGGEEDELLDWQLPLCFMKKRHKEKIEGPTGVPQTWRMKERMRTVSVALVLCLNIGVDPPDVVKTNPCARKECWIDPQQLNPTKASEAIGNNLQQQYERWHSRARYKQSLDPTVDEVKKLCTSLRRNAKEDRVLFHYNGHGVPRPTQNGEIWVFNKQYTQYIPLSIYDLQTWMGSPSIYVYDCSNAGLIIDCFQQFSAQREEEYEKALAQGSPVPVIPPARNCIHLAACSSTELLPMSPDLPADLFTACLTTPMTIALRWFIKQKNHNLVPDITVDMVEKIPGGFKDRRTPLGELHWIFDAVTEIIAWNTLPRDDFHRLFREDSLLASLFRNFLLAERVMRSYNCTPVTYPKIPSTYHHPMWQAWDLALDQCLSQLPVVIEDEKKYKNSLFFSEQLTAFQVWLAMGNAERDPPEQLPIMLQAVLSPVHRLRALDLLGRFIDMGPWAVISVLSVGIFPYVLRLLSSPVRELRPLMVFIWAKILAIDSRCQSDLVKEEHHNYFLSVIADACMPAEHRTTGSFVLARIIHDNPAGQEACFKGSMISTCLEQLTDPHPLLRQWLALCLGLIWTQYDAARWCGIRDSAPEKLYKLLADPLPEVRAAAVFALGRMIANTGDRSDHANQIDHNIATHLSSTVGNDGSPLVRKELVVAFYGLITQFEHFFSVVAVQFLEEDRQREIMGTSPHSHEPETKKGWILVAQGSENTFMTSTDSGTLKKHSSGLLDLPGREGSSSSDSSIRSEAESIWVRAPSCNTLHETVYTKVWKAMLNLSIDPYPEVANMAKRVVNTITVKATMAMTIQPKYHSNQSSVSGSPGLSDELPPLQKSQSVHALSTAKNPASPTAMSPDARVHRSSTSSAFPANGIYKPHSIQFSAKRKIFDKGPDVFPSADEEESDSDDESTLTQPILVKTNFYEWCCSYFAQPVMKAPDDLDVNSPQRIEREWRFLRNCKVRKQSQKQLYTTPPTRLDDEIFINKNTNPPGVIKFHPYLPHLAVADRKSVSIWDYEVGSKLNNFQNGNGKSSRISSMDILNSHDIPLLLTGSDDGAVRVWRNYCDEENGPLSLVTAWTALSGMLTPHKGMGAGLVTEWEQQSGKLLASGDVKKIRVWDAHREMVVQDIPTGAESCITSLTSSLPVIVAGVGDGTVRIYDRRNPRNSAMTLREHQGWVVKVFLQEKSEGHIISGSVGGEIKFWDQRMTSSVRTIESTLPTLASMDIHPEADLIACGSASQRIKVMNLFGDELSHIRYHDGFIGQRIGPVSCLAFHPYWTYLAAGSTDSFLSVYAAQKPSALSLDDLGI